MRRKDRYGWVRHTGREEWNDSIRRQSEAMMITPGNLLLNIDDVLPVR